MTDWINRAIAADVGVVEEACERALQTGTCGVMVRRGMHRGDVGGFVMTTEAWPSPYVPYGQIFEV